jgi:hypothetical protein
MKLASSIAGPGQIVTVRGQVFQSGQGVFDLGGHAILNSIPKGHGITFVGFVEIVACGASNDKAQSLDVSASLSLPSINPTLQQCLDVIGSSLDPYDMSDADAHDMRQLLARPVAKTTLDAKPLGRP